MSDYDQVNHCCKLCKTIMPFTEIDLKSHTKNECDVDRMFNDLKYAKIKRKEVIKCPLQ